MAKMANHLLSTTLFQIRANPETDPEYGPEPEAPQEGEDMEIMDDGTVKGHWNMRLTSFQKLMFFKVFKEEKTVFGVTDFVRENLGQAFVESPNVALQTLYDDMNKVHNYEIRSLNICMISLNLNLINSTKS